MNRCLNPACDRAFKPGRYGKRQVVCSGTYRAKCGPKCAGKKCPRCKGSGSWARPCREWYKAHQLATAPPPRGLGESWPKVERKLVDLPLRHAVLIRVARATGLRKGELLGLTWADVLEGAAPASTSPFAGNGMTSGDSSSRKPGPRGRPTSTPTPGPHSRTSLTSGLHAARRRAPRRESGRFRAPARGECGRGFNGRSASRTRRRGSPTASMTSGIRSASSSSPPGKSGSLNRC